MAKYELNVRDYVRIIRKRRYVIAATFIIVLIGTFFYTSKQPTFYQSSTTVKIEERKTVAGLLTEWIVYSPADVMESETRMIKGYSIMKKAAALLGMINNKSTLNQVNGAIGFLQGSVATERIGQTNMIKITATAATAKGAMDIAEAVANSYIDENLTSKAKQFRQARQFIEDQLAALDTRVKKTEQKLKRYAEQVKSIGLADPIQQKLADLEFELAEMRQRYTDKHPRVIQRKQEIADLEAQLRSFSGKELEYGRMLREVEVNKKLYGMLKEKLEEARITEAQKVSDVSIVDPAVMPGGPISANKKMTALAGIIMGLILGIAFAFIFETLDTSINTIEDVEKVVKLRVLGLVPPIKRVTKKKSNFFAELKEQIFPSPIKPALDDEPIYLIAHYEPSSTSAEAYRNILTNLKLDKNRKTVIVTSSGPREGKSSIVCNLGIIMAQAGLKTCIVGADLRRPTLDKAFGVKREPGLNELATGSATLKEALNNIVDIIVGDMNFDDIRKTPGLDNLWILPSGHLSYNPAEILKSKEITKVIEELKKRFDVIIFDAPPVLPVTDASLLAPQMDAVVLVYEIGRTSREALIRAKIQLESVGAKITGVILNHTQPETEPVSSYPYYHYKYGYTTKGEVEKRHRTAEEKLAQV